MFVLSISSLKGGVGKTSVALGLASAAYTRGIPTLVVDMDPQADASTGLGIPVTTEVDVADVLAAPRSRVLERAIVPSSWSEGKVGHIDVVPGSPRAAEFDRPSLSDRYLRRMREALEKIGTGYRLVIIDCPPSLNGLTRAAWTASDQVAVVTEPGLFSVAAADRALRAAEELHRRNDVSLTPLGVVVNRVRPGSLEHGYRINELKEMFGPLVVDPPVPERTVLQQAQGSARPIHQWPGSAAAELATAFDGILERVLRAESARPGASTDEAGEEDSAAKTADTGTTNSAAEEPSPGATTTSTPTSTAPKSGAGKPGGEKSGAVKPGADTPAAGKPGVPKTAEGSTTAPDGKSAAGSVPSSRLTDPPPTVPLTVVKDTVTDSGKATTQAPAGPAKAQGTSAAGSAKTGNRKTGAAKADTSKTGTGKSGSANKPGSGA
ncbi:ParA family protein [Brevibacterium litoralis]|uniref:ParA family protein n=1 Tax=Brevibacterium litoralis TaxID=3138935 RepID=UPI0032EFFE54